MGLKTKVPVIDNNSHFNNDEYGFNSLVIVSSDVTQQAVKDTSYLKEFVETLKPYQESDALFNETVTLVVSSVEKYKKINKLIYSPTGPLDRHIDDVRRFADAAEKGVKRALQAGSKHILLAVLDNYPSIDARNAYKLYDCVSLLGAMYALYVPFEIREDVPDKAVKAEILGFSSSLNDFTFALGVEEGRLACRDIGGSDPERMAPPNVVKYVKSLFPSDSCITVETIHDDNILNKEYPLFYAVNRAAKVVERHRGRVVFLTYDSQDKPEKTLFLVGKGVTYDTGGADIKAGGVMAGMHRDKCGAAAVAGFFQILNKLKPKNIKVVGALGLVRNSIGSDAYVSDEIITSRAGVRVRVGNTDAEGRMVMADILCHMKEKALSSVNPYLFTIATLTGHAVLACGEAYSIIVDNGPADIENVGLKIQEAGAEIGDMFERSTLRREDYGTCKAATEYEDLLQCNNQPSSKTPRGHQFPAAFMIKASGLDKHDINSSQPLKYSHIDIAGSAGPFPGIPTGAPVAALAHYFLH